MFEQRTIVDQVEVRTDGELRIRMDKQLIKDGEATGDPRWHRANLLPGGDPDALLAAVNDHLVKMKEGLVADADWDIVRRLAASEHTPTVTAAWQEKQATELALQASRVPSAKPT